MKWPCMCAWVCSPGQAMNLHFKSSLSYMHVGCLSSSSSMESGDNCNLANIMQLKISDQLNKPAHCFIFKYGFYYSSDI